MQRCAISWTRRPACAPAPRVRRRRLRDSAPHRSKQSLRRTSLKHLAVDDSRPDCYPSPEWDLTGRRSTTKAAARLLRMYNLRNEEPVTHDLAQLAQVTLTVDEYTRHRLRPGDLLISRVNSYERVWASVLWSKREQMATYVRTCFCESTSMSAVEPCVCRRTGHDEAGARLGFEGSLVARSGSHQ